MEDHRGTDRGVQTLRVLLRLYPQSYRRRYAAEMESFFIQERRASGGGPRFWIRLVKDHLEAAWAVRRRVRSQGGARMGRWGDDLHGAVRSLRRAPAFTLFAVATLALGIGATTAVFSVLDRVLLRPLPYPSSERMLVVGIDARHDPGSPGPLSVPLMLRFQAAPGPADAVVAATSSGAVLSDRGDPERLETTRVTRGFFEFFGARPAAGRLLGSADYDSGAPRVLVLGHELWTRRYGSDPGIVGRSIRLDDEPYTVVGVLADDFVPPSHVADARDLWVPLSLAGENTDRGSFFLSAVARLRPGATDTDLDAHADHVVAEVYSEGERPNFLLGGTVRNYREIVVGSLGGTLGRVMAAVALLLLIACVNVASLLLTRGARRVHELAVRSAMGAGKMRLIRQLLAEGVLMALAGGVLGSGLAWGSVELFRIYAPRGLPRLEEVAVDGWGLAFSLVLGLVTVLVFGLLPALRSAAAAGFHATSHARRATLSSREGRLRGGLVAVETALAVILAVGSALLAHDLVMLAEEDPGFRPEGVVAVNLDLRSRYGRGEWLGFWERLLDGARGLPGVTRASLATQVPYTGTRIAGTFRPEGLESSPGEFIIQVMVAGDYVQTLGTRLVEGRTFAGGDDGSTDVVLVNEALVRRYWPGESAVGKRIISGGQGVDDEPTFEVVGVLADVRTRVGRDVPPHVFLPVPAAPVGSMELLVRTDGETEAMVPALRTLVRRLDPSLAVTRIATVEGLSREGLSRPRFYTVLFLGFAAVALLLAVVGVYGTTAYAMRGRVREIGIRMALGARRGRVVARAVVRTSTAVGAGVVVGLVVAGVGSVVMADVLTHVRPRDTLAYGVVAMLVMVAGVTAAWIPARQAGRVDPATTLRDEG